MGDLIGQLAASLPEARPRRRFLLRVLGGWLFLFLGGAWLVHAVLAHEEAELEALSRALSVAIVDGLRQTVLRTLEAGETVLDLVQGRHDLLRQGNERGAQTIADHVVAMTQRSGLGLLQVTTTDRDGVITWSTTPGWEPLSLSDRTHIRVHFDRPPAIFFSEPLVGRVSGRWSVQLTHPLLDSAGKLDGVAVVSLDPILLSGRLGEAAFGEGSVAALLRLPDGVLLARSQDADRQLARERLPDHPAVLAARHQDRGVLRTRSPMDGQELIMAFRRVGDDQLVVVYAEDWAASRHVMEVLTRWGWMSFAAGMLLLLAAGIGALRVTELREVRRQLAEVQANRAASMAAWSRLEALLAASPVVIYAWRLGGAPPSPRAAFAPDFVSPNLQRILGCGSDSFVDPARMRALMDDPGWAERSAFLERTLRDGQASVEYRWRWPNGTWRWLREEACLVDPSPAAGFDLVGYLLDVTEERAARAQAAASARLNMLGELTASIAHEFTQPLAVISIAAETAVAVLESGAGDGVERARGTLKQIAAQAERCRSVVQHLRVFSRPDDRQPVGQVALRSVVDGAMVLMRGALHDAGVILRLAPPDGLPMIRANAVGAEQVLVNLLLNARDALVELPPGRPRFISISAVQRADRLHVTVADTGGGIQAELLERVFEPFVTTKDNDKGTGLGLAICQATMRAFGGNITVRNGADGAEFLLDFAVAREDAHSKGAAFA